MTWLTTCPRCDTTFRIGFRQLDAHQGMVRCGKCAHVFNAREHLQSTADGLPPPPAATTPPKAAETPPPHEDALSIFDAAIAANSPEPAPAPEAQTAALAEEPATPPATLAEEPAAPQAAPVMEPAPDPTPEAVQARRRGWPWLAGSVLLLALLAVQGLYFFRTPLAAAHPAMKPILTRLCGVLGCQIPLPRTNDGDVLGIAGSDLQTDPTRPNLLILNAVLRNRAPHPYEYPLLEVTLTDAADRPVLQRVLQPAEYLPPGTRLDAGVPPRSETGIKLNLAVSDIAPVGFRLYLFYPLP